MYFEILRIKLFIIKSDFACAISCGFAVLNKTVFNYMIGAIMTNCVSVCD